MKSRTLTLITSLLASCGLLWGGIRLAAQDTKPVSQKPDAAIGYRVREIPTPRDWLSSLRDPDLSGSSLRDPDLSGLAIESARSRPVGIESARSRPVGIGYDQETQTPSQGSDAKSDALANTASPAQGQAEDTESASNAPAAKATEPGLTKRKGRRGVSRAALVVRGHDVELKAGDSAEAVVVIGGSAKIRGNVQDAVVAIGGDVDVEGAEVGDAVVAVLGNVRAGQGANIHGDVVAVGGKVETAEDATVQGHTVELDFGQIGLGLSWLRPWFAHCFLRLRPLAPQVGWVWGVAGVFFLVYLLVAAVFPRPVQACVDELTRRPATTFLMGLLTKLLLPLVLLILIATGLGLLVVPFVLAALWLGAIVGKVALLESLGLKMGRQFGAGALQKPLLAFLVGAAIITLLYLVPVVGLLTFAIISVWGLGAAVTAAFGGLRRELPPKPAAPALVPNLGAPVMAASTGSAGVPAGPGPTLPAQPSAATQSEQAQSPTSTAILTTPPPVPLPEILSHPRAGFWERMGAGFLDLVLVSIAGGLVGHAPLGFLVALAYFAGMWTWKATTIGGIVLGLKIVRVDGRPVTFAVALVRALAAAFSVFVLFLGFLWIAWDRDKQGWHDIIAGTLVLRLPRGTPLVCV